LVSASETEPFCAYIFKNVVDPFVGRVSYIKIISGNARPGDNFVNANRGTSDRISKLYWARGKEQVEIEAASCGEIVVLPKLKEGSVGETLTHKDRKMKIVPPQFPEPMFSRSVNPKSKTDIDKIRTVFRGSPRAILLSSGSTILKLEKRSCLVSERYILTS